MITTPLMENSVDLLVPTSAAARNAVDQSVVQSLLWIARNGSSQWPADHSRGSAFTAGRLHADTPDVAVIVRAHRELPVQKLIELIDIVKSAQITKVGVVTTPDQP